MTFPIIGTIAILLGIISSVSYTWKKIQAAFELLSLEETDKRMLIFMLFAIGGFDFLAKLPNVCTDYIPKLPNILIFVFILFFVLTILARKFKVGE